ncbi:response regulator transcription factor [Lacicoccus qingdaonensis]|uniref:Two component transcriptional regulator, LuxR family n=1 Tax=Lacicoccus qingdaonensis TaxID=576118 RepID=A0A1G9HBZ1_9BACL|nr:response regulator transcription factor [Salinicoccus qingdaonensis]SDL10427.1 two component transcriptional regulator, LuxR family [Salinicoccus qingdaonensis]
MIKVVLAEDQNMLLGALGSLLDMEDDIEVAGKAADGEEALKLVEELNPDICLMDIEMPVMTGLEAAEHLMDHDCKVIILTTFLRPGYFERAKKANVSGYLLKDSPSEALAQSIRQIMKGKRIYSPELIEVAFELDNPLTKREQEIVQHLADGEPTKKIAEKLNLSNGTVRNYVSIVLDKLDAKNRIEAISKAIDKGWLK